MWGRPRYRLLPKRHKVATSRIRGWKFLINQLSVTVIDLLCISMAKPSLSLAVRSASFVNMLSRTMSWIGLFSRSLDDGQQEPCQYEVNPMRRLESVSWMTNKCTWSCRSNYVQFYIKVVDETIISWCLINQMFLIYRSPHWFGNLISEKR